MSRAGRKSVGDGFSYDTDVYAFVNNDINASEGID
jgi:hypothetical protein